MGLTNPALPSKTLRGATVQQPPLAWDYANPPMGSACRRPFRRDQQAAVLSAHNPSRSVEANAMASTLVSATPLCPFDPAVCCSRCGGAAYARPLLGLGIEIELWRCEYSVLCDAHGPPGER
jgi:hypothetical protein